MFSYFGSKKRLAKLYPPPQSATTLIVEPFAGAAAYALLHHTNPVLLVEAYRPVFDIWDWLINSATPEEILALPVDIPAGTRLTDESLRHLTPVQKLIIGYNSASLRSYAPIKTSSNAEWSLWNEKTRLKLSQDVLKVKHWKIVFGDYTDATDVISSEVECSITWFIDPPYQFGGAYYPFHKINYDELSHWINSLADKKRFVQQQFIVCENNKNQWLDSSITKVVKDTPALKRGVRQIEVINYFLC